jgi:putative phosphoesterase
MKIALIADVHGNLPALEAVIAHANSHGAEEFWNLGDMVGYGPFPDECVKLLRKTCQRHIFGNYDEKSLSKKKIEKMREKGKDPDKVFSFEWANQHLTEESVEFIRSLPPVQPVDVGGRRVLITHGSPEGTEDSLTPQTPLSRLEELAKLTDAELVVCGHTHIPFDRAAAGVRFVNPGGAGRSFDGDPRASYALVDISPKGIAVEHFRLDFDIDSLASEMRVYNFPERIVRSLLEARSLEELDDTAHAAGAEEVVNRALELGARCKFEKEHALKVTALALKIFDGLSAVHGLTDRERLYLQCGGLLHDIGFSTDPGKHHKVSRDVILEAAELPLSRRERMIVGLLAR